MATTNLSIQSANGFCLTCPNCGSVIEDIVIRREFYPMVPCEDCGADNELMIELAP